MTNEGKFRKKTWDKNIKEKIMNEVGDELMVLKGVVKVRVDLRDLTEALKDRFKRL
jgi:hypothetical protein